MHKTSKRVARAALGVATILTLVLSPFGSGFGAFFSGNAAKADTFTVTGFVYLADGTTPVSNAHPYLMYPDRGFYLGTAPSGSSGPVGYYSFSNVAAGSYLLVANPPDGMTGVIRSNEIMITVGSGITTQNITLNSTPKTVTGTVTYRGTTTPVVNAQVNAMSMGNGMGGGNQATTDAAGNYTLPLPASSQYGLNLNAPAGADWSYNEPQVMVSFTADSSTESRTMNFQVTKATATITGTVTYASTGAPVMEGNVNAWSANGAGGGGNAQITSGSYSMKVPAGMFNVNFWSPTPNLTAIPTLVNITDGQTLTANLVVKVKTAHLVGRAINGVGGPAIAGARLHAWCRPLDSTQNSGPTPGIDGNAETGADGSFDIAILSGICNINVDQGGMNNSNETTYVLKTQLPETTVETDTSTVSLGDVVMVKADATIHVTVKNEAGTTVSGVQGYVNAMKASTENFGPGENYGAPLMPDGTANIKLPSSVFSLVKLNIFMGQDSEYSISDAGSTVTVVADQTTPAILTLVRNNSSIYGSLVDTNGIPLSKCTPPAGQFSFGDVFINNPSNNTFRNAQFKEDCSYRVSVVAGTYQFGYNFREGSGLLNTPPGPDPVVVKAGENVVKNITALVGDANIKVQILTSAGTPVPNAFVNASNEVELFRSGDQGGPNNGPKDLQGPGFKDKNGKAGDPFEVCMKAYQKKDAKQIKACEGMKLPDISTGPGGCKNVGACVKFCMVPKNQAECGKFKGSEQGGQSGPQTGPGGCKSETECKAYCSKTENQTECSKFGPAEGQMTGAAFLKGKVKGESTQNANQVGGPSADDFKNVLRTGGMTDRNGNVSLSVVSGHKYEVMANPQPGSADMPAKSQVVDLTNAKSASITLAFRQADAKISGKVTGGGPYGFCHGWEESGNFSGGEIRNGKYEINVSKGVWHIGCDSAWDRNFARSEEIVIVVDGSSKSITQNFKLDTNSNFRIPPAYTSTFDAGNAQTIVLEDGTTIIASASAFASSGSNVTLTATPTANLQSQMNAKPAWYGYEFSAKDSNGADITKFNSNVTIIFKYTDAMLEAAGVDESALLPRYFDEATNTWKSPDNTTQDLAANTITIVTDHFSKHALTSNGKAVSLTAVNKGTGKNKGSFTVGKKKVTAFAGTNINVSTTSYGGKTGQLIFVSPAENLKKGTSSVKVYSTSGKLVKTITPYTGYKGSLNLLLSDMTKDGKSDLAIVRSSQNTEVKIYNVAKKYASYKVATGASRNANVTVTTLEPYQTGLSSLTMLIKQGRTTDLKVFNFSTKKGFQEDKALNESNPRFKISGSSVSLIILKPNGKASNSLSSTKTSTKVNLVGANFEKGMVATIGSITGTVKVTNGKAASVTFDGTKLGKGKKTLKLVNPSGSSGSISVTVK